MAVVSTIVTVMVVAVGVAAMPISCMVNIMKVRLVMIPISLGGELAVAVSMVTVMGVVVVRRL